MYYLLYKWNLSVWIIFLFQSDLIPNQHEAKTYVDRPFDSLDRPLDPKDRPFNPKDCPVDLKDRPFDPKDRPFDLKDRPFDQKHQPLDPKDQQVSFFWSLTNGYCVVQLGCQPSRLEIYN